jgi:nitrogen fixation protein FixH
MTDVSSRGAFRFTGWHMLALAMAFFGVVISVNILLAVVSARSWTGMVVEDSYVAGQQFETARKAHDAQEMAGWKPTFDYASGTARLTIVDASGQSLDIGDVSVLINRPVGGHEDQVLALTRQSDGTYAAPLALPVGAWDATVSADKTTLGPFRLERRFYVRNDR